MKNKKILASILSLLLLNHTTSNTMDFSKITNKTAITTLTAAAGSMALAYGSSFAKDLLIEIKKQIVQKSGLCTKDSIEYISKKLFETNTHSIFDVYQPKDLTQNLSSIGGYETEKNSCNQILNYLQNPIKFTQKGTKPIKGLLLYGSPGTGKTSFVKALAGQVHCPLVSIQASKILTGRGMFGGSQNIAKLFQTAKNLATKQKPCIIFIDEIDVIAKQRQKDTKIDEASTTLLRLMEELDKTDINNPIVCIAATNHIDHLDEALVRAERLDTHIHIKLPSKHDRINILKVHLKNIDLDKTAINIEALADRTVDFSGADLASLVTRAKHIATENGLEHLTQTELEQALTMKLFYCLGENMDHESFVIKAYQQAARTIISHIKKPYNIINSITIALQKQKNQKFEGMTITELQVACKRKEDFLSDIDELLASKCIEESIFNTTTDIGIEDSKKAKTIADYIAKIFDTKLSSDEFMKQEYNKVKFLLNEHGSAITDIAHLLLEKKILYHKDLESLLPFVEQKSSINHARKVDQILKELNQKDTNLRVSSQDSIDTQVTKWDRANSATPTLKEDINPNDI